MGERKQKFLNLYMAERKIRIYKTPEESETFYRKFINRIILQEALHRISITQQRYCCDYPQKNNELFSKYEFSAS